MDARQSPSFESPVPNPAASFAAARYPLLQEAHFHPEHARLASDTPLFTTCWALTGAFILLAGFFLESGTHTIKLAGLTVLLLAIPVFVAERLVRRARIRASMNKRRVAVDELITLRAALSQYLTDLDRRTSRYFHCVTNTKVVTYFMLRQIDNSLGELLARIDEFMRVSSADNHFRLEKALRGTLEYRDGFAFNSGQLHHTPMYLLPSRVQELIVDLEKGISILEQEILHYREQASELVANPELAAPETPRASKEDDWVI